MNDRRLLFVRVLAVIIVIVPILRLFNVQITNHAAYLAASNSRATPTVVEKAPRGDIKDRNGKSLVTNREGYSLLWIKTAATDSEINPMLAKVVEILAESQYMLSDSLPVSAVQPYEYIFTDNNSNNSTEDEKELWFSDKKRVKIEMTADEVIAEYRKVYNISDDIPEHVARKIIGIRYDADTNGFSFASPYCIARDIDIEIISKIKERKTEFPDIEVSTDYFRQYEYGSLAAHTLGRIGKIYKEEYDKLRDKGYGFNDLVGKQGIEKICESDLHGKDGRRVLLPSGTEELPGVKSEEAVAGNYVVLTIDSGLQMACEEALKNTIEEIALKGQGAGLQKGADADAGAAVVIDVRNGEVLALASYPSYNPEVFNEMYAQMLEDERKPLWNRALSGTYSPGSTFKPLTAIAALETGAVTSDERLYCDGVYKVFKDYQPKCWIYLDYKRTHGWENVTKAIEDSCNLYFYEAGRRTGIDSLGEYAKMFGLGEYTGIELGEESKGAMAGPEYKKKLEGEDAEWFGGDTIQASIGQSYSNFTPIQLANYIATIANGGTRYRPHLVKSVNRTDDGKAVKITEPVIEKMAQVSKDNISIVKKGMYGVVDEGSASSIFAGYPIEIGGKTGTAQGNSNESNTALFVAFAPYDNPEIAVSVVIEHGVRGVNAANVAKKIFDEYFSLDTVVEERYEVGELLP